MMYFSGYEDNQQKKVLGSMTHSKETVDTDNLSRKAIDGCRTNPQDDSGAVTSAVKEDTSDGTFPGDSKSKVDDFDAIFIASAEQVNEEATAQQDVEDN